jgi:hypothetical protein
MSIITKYSEVTRKTVPGTHGYVYESRMCTIHGKTEMQFYIEWLNDSMFCDGWFFESELDLISE